jgi:protein-S-isoprenylcysteine O-methyltransferase Ste14
MFLRALLAFLACPGVVALIVPALIASGRRESAVVHPAGFVLLGAGLALLLWCVRDFYVAGKGTLAPWDPPKSLVVVGLYRWSRNPMYVAVSLTLLGWAAAYESRTLLVYALAVMTAFHLRVVFAEEPWLAKTHGESWTAYRRQVRRWVGRVDAATAERRDDE